MKKNLFWIVYGLAVFLLTACNENKPTATMIEGAWELLQVEKNDEGFGTTTTYQSKEDVWLFQDGHISGWKYVQQDGDKDEFWENYDSDCEREYVIEGEYPNMKIIEVTRRTNESETTIRNQRYKVEKLTEKELVLIPVPTSIRYVFRRENTLVDYLSAKEKE